MVFKLAVAGVAYERFENDVKMYGTQTDCGLRLNEVMFENDVKMYAT